MDAAFLEQLLHEDESYFGHKKGPLPSWDLR